MAIDTSWANVSLLCPFSVDAQDVKGKVVTPLNGAALSSAVGTPFGAGNACYFDGTNDYLALADSADWAVGTGDFIIDGWVYPTSFPGGGTSNDMCLINIPGSPQFFFYIDNTTGKPILWNGTTGYTGANALTINAWNYVWAKRASSTLTIGIGTTTGITQASYTTNFAAYAGVTVGGLTASRYLHGYLSNLRLTKASRTIVLPTTPHPRPTISGHIYDAAAAPVAKTVLVRDRSTGLYLGGANSDPSTGLYTFYPPDFGEAIVERIDELADPVTDEAVFDLDPSVGAVGGTLPADTRGHALTFLGDAKISTDALSFVFDGSGDVIQSASSRYTLGTDDFCIDIEFYPINGGRGSNYARLFQLGANTTAGTLVIFTGTTTPTIIEAKFWDGATYQSLANSSPTTYADNAWHKLQLRRVAGVFFMTIDDVLVSTSATTAYNIAAATLSIGANAANAENFYGRIGKVRISRGARRAAAATPTSRLLKMPADGGSGENALIYDRVIPGG